MSVEFDFQPNPEIQAFAIANILTDVTKYEVIYREYLGHPQASRIADRYHLLRMAQGSYVSELTEMGFTEVAQEAIHLGYSQAQTKIKRLP